MCTSRFHRVIGQPDEANVVALDLDGVERRLSLLAYDGPPLSTGSWVVAHSGYALASADDEEVRLAFADLALAQASTQASSDDKEAP